MLAMVACAGCYGVPDRFPPNGVYRARLEREYRQPFSPTRREELQQVLAQLFGTPDAPRVPGIEKTRDLFDKDLLTAAAGPVGSDATGRSRGLYREHCAVCHDISGGGIGPAAFVLSPYPRDFRRGLYKFKSTPKGAKPTEDDLRRLLQTGIPGTGMPSYRALPTWEIDALVQYVKYLSVRGEVERRLIDFAAGELEPDEPLIDEDAPNEEQSRRRAGIDEIVTAVATSWLQSESMITPVPERDAPLDLAGSIERGRSLFFGDVANCVKCHGKTAEGDGQTTDYDDWAKEIDPGDRLALAAYRKSGALNPRTIRPRNLRLGLYHGGSRPDDLYRRIVNGIDGTPMPAALIRPAGAAAGAKGLTRQDIWCLIDFIRSLPQRRVTSAEP